MYEWENIRRLVEKYFEERYRGFAGGGNPAFEKYCCGKFMEEQEKRYILQLEDAASKGLVYTDWQLKLTFRKIIALGRQAWVEVKEGHRVIFKIIGYPPSYMDGMVHRIKLVKMRNRWYIVEHYCQDEYSIYAKPVKSGRGDSIQNNQEQFGKGKARLLAYNREAAVAYAHRWALDRNPRYHNFEGQGGDCTNFCSQVLHAGGAPMKVDKVKGWYYLSLNLRSPSWTAVEPLYRFLMTNKGRGPHGEDASPQEIKLGDIIQLDFPGSEAFNHSLVVVSNPEPGNINRILIATHTIDRDNYPLIYYKWRNIRYIHIKGYLM